MLRPDAEQGRRRVAVYGLSSSLEPNAVRYIGQTVMPVHERAKVHVRHARKYAHRHISTWINSVLRSGGNIVHVVLDPDAEWNETERELIAKHRAAGASLVNGTDGGDGMVGRRMSAAAKAHLSSVMTGRKRSAEHNAALSKALTGRKTPQATRLKIAAAMKGRAPSNLEAIQAGNKGIKRGDGLKRQISEKLKGRQVTSTEKLLKNLEAARGLAH